MIKKFCLVLVLLFLGPGLVHAAIPTGFIDKVDNLVIAGWAKDPDYSGSIQVHIYIDGKFVKGLTANNNRSDLGGNFGFGYQHGYLGPGNHLINVYAIGVDSAGTPNNENFDLSGSPHNFVANNEYWLYSPDGKVKVALNAKFGGSITKIIDTQNFGTFNLINDSQGGALFQSALWLLPKHTELPPGCAGGPDQWNDNPTQGGFVADGLVGNPIGIFGTDENLPDPNEFIRYENDSRTVHFKTRYIRYDFCAEGQATSANRNLWDTNFYLEQWVYFDDKFSNTLVQKSKITYDGSGSREVNNGGGLQVIFAFHLPRVAYPSNGTVKIEQKPNNSATPLAVDKNWAAIIGDNVDAGIGMVIAPGARSDVDISRFNIEIRGNSGVAGENTSMIYPLGGGAIYDTVGQTSNLTVRMEKGPNPWNGNMYHHTFNNTSSFEWTMYFPIGKLDMIKTESEKILADPANFGFPPSCTPRLNGDFDGNGTVNFNDYLTWRTGFFTNPDNKTADANCSGTVDLLDLQAWVNGFNPS